MTKYWHANGEPSSRRYGACPPPYQVIPDRQRYPSEGIRRSTRSYTLPVQEAQLPECNLDTERESKESRRRIPVACGRCRKRKIRCSGPQNDDSCLNCRNAGNAECQFNRVSSEELGFKSTLDFGYNTELARAVHTRGSSQANSYRPPTPNYNYAPNPIPTNLPTLYRSQPSADYQFEPKTPCSLPPVNTDYNEDGFDYVIPAVNYPLYGQELVGGLSSYSSYGPGRVWLSGTQTTRGSLNNMYFGPDTNAYSPQQMHYNGQACGLRSSLTTQASLYSFSDMNSSLPASDALNSHTRILPILSPTRRNNSGPVSLNRVVGDLSYASNAINGVSGDSATASQLITGGHSTPLGYIPNSENSNNVDGYSFNSLTGTLSQSQSEMYDSSDGWSLAPLMTDPALHSSNSSSDLYQSDCNEASRKASQSSQSPLTARHNSTSDVYTYDASGASQKPSQSSNGTLSSLSHSLTTSHNATSEIHCEQRNDVSRKVSQSSKSIASKSVTTGRSYTGSHSQEKSVMPCVSSMTSTDVARTQCSRP